MNIGIGMLVGIIVGGIVLLILIIVGIVCCCKKCHAKNVILNHGAPTTYINGQPVPMQASVYQPETFKDMVIIWEVWMVLW